MKIVRYFNDYYDGGMAHGHDDRLVYVRKTEEKPLPDFLRSIRSLVGWCREDRALFDLDSPAVRRKEYITSGFAVIFCGELYLGRKVNQRVYDGCMMSPGPKTEIFYDKGSLASHFPVFDVKKTDKEEKRERRYNSLLGRPMSFSLPATIQPTIISGLREWAIEERITAAAIHYSYNERDQVMTLNPRLADYEFFRVMDPVTTFQNLEMWLGGVVSQRENSTVNISDKDRVFQHGFDDYSFRKYPEKTKA